MLNIHKNIYDRLDNFININQVPNILLHGPVGSGKRTILNNFINKIYKNNKTDINSYVMYVNCAHNKGIRFIRDEFQSCSSYR